MGTSRLLSKHGFITNLDKSAHLGSVLSTVIGTPIIVRQDGRIRSDPQSPPESAGKSANVRQLKIRGGLPGGLRRTPADPPRTKSAGDCADWSFYTTTFIRLQTPLQTRVVTFIILNDNHATFNQIAQRQTFPLSNFEIKKDILVHNSLSSTK